MQFYSVHQFHVAFQCELLCFSPARYITMVMTSEETHTNKEGKIPGLLATGIDSSAN